MQRRKSLPGKRYALLAVLWTAAAGAQQDPRAQQLCGEANQIAQELTKISGMPLHHRVPCDFITKAKINEFLQKRVKEVAKPGEIRAEELTLKKFGLVPADFDLAKNTVDLLTEQAAAFYDYDKKKLFITETTPSETQEPVLAHELSHALADQNYNLAKFIRQGRQSDDGSTARLAVMEGQATWLMAEYLARKNGQSLKDSPALVQMMSSTSDASGQFPVYENAPLYLRQTLVCVTGVDVAVLRDIGRKITRGTRTVPDSPHHPAVPGKPRQGHQHRNRNRLGDRRGAGVLYAVPGKAITSPSYSARNSERGTFSQRHSVLIDQEDESRFSRRARRKLMPRAIKQTAGALNKIFVCREKSLVTAIKLLKVNGIKIFGRI